jgi:hypothetical protein
VCARARMCVCVSIVRIYTLMANYFCLLREAVHVRNNGLLVFPSCV